MQKDRNGRSPIQGPNSTDLSDLLDFAPPSETAWKTLNLVRKWCAWREEKRGDKWTKVPYAGTDRMARANDPSTWLTRARAEAVAVELSAERLKGVGLFLGGDGDLRFGGIDLDSCRGLLGDLQPWATEVLTRFASYAEVSPSGTGVKVFFAYRAADLEPMRAIMGTKWGCNFSRGDHTEIGLFLGHKYFTLTGQGIESAPETIQTVDRAALEWLITDAGPRFKGDAPESSTKDDSRSGRAFRLAGECRRAGVGFDYYKAEIAKDPALAEWAKDARQVQRAWDRNAGEDLSTVLCEMEDLPDLAEAAHGNPVTELNRDHAAVMIGGKFRIVRETAGGFEVFQPEELHKLNANNRVKVPGKAATEPVTAQWMRHPSRRTYAGGMVFNPKETPAGTYNIWRGWAVQADPNASCDLFLAHVRNVICNGNEREYGWLLGWMAHLVQHPEQKPGTAVVLRGKKGAGKDTFGDYLGALLGRRHHVKIAQPDHLTGRFNAHLENGLLLHLEEGFWAGDKAGGGVLKNLITCPTLQIERKGIDPYEVEHFARLLITSNEDWVVPATPGERRYFVLDVSPARAKDTAYFGAIWKEHSNGGAGALLHFLQCYDLSGFDVRNPPETSGLTRQKLQGLMNVDAWWHDRLTNADLALGSDGFDRETKWRDRPISIQRAALKSDYEAWLARRKWHGEPLSAESFGRKLRDMCCGLRDERQRTSDGRPRHYIIPPLPEARAAFAAYIGGNLEWDD